MTRTPRYRPLSPADYLLSPWKNGGGVSTTIAGECLPGASHGDWSCVIWQLGRTQIIAPAPFSDLSGFERMQLVIGGRGLVLETPEGDIDLRIPFHPVRYDGGTPIVSRLENGPVEVVNLIARRDLVAIDLVVLAEAGDIARNSEISLPPGQHIVYAPTTKTNVLLDGIEMILPTHHAVSLDRAATLQWVVGIAVVATIVRH